MTAYRMKDMSVVDNISLNVLENVERFGRFCFPGTLQMQSLMSDMNLTILFDPKDMAEHRVFVEIAIAESLGEVFDDGDDNGE